MPYILWHWLLYVQDGFVVPTAQAGNQCINLEGNLFLYVPEIGLLSVRANTASTTVQGLTLPPKQIYRNDFHFTNPAYIIDFNFLKVFTDVPVIAVTFRRLIPFFNKANSFAYCSLYSISDLRYEAGRPILIPCSLHLFIY